MSLPKSQAAPLKIRQAFWIEANGRVIPLLCQEGCLQHRRRRGGRSRAMFRCERPVLLMAAPYRACAGSAHCRRNATNGIRGWWPTVANCPYYRSRYCRRLGPSGLLLDVPRCSTPTLAVQWSHRPQGCRLSASRRNRESCRKFQSPRADSIPGTEPGFRRPGIPTGTFHRRIGDPGRAIESRHCALWWPRTAERPVQKEFPRTKIRNWRSSNQR